MIPIASLDAGMIIGETAEMPLHTMGILILELPEDYEGSPYDAMRRMFEARISRVPPFRRRVIQDPLHIGDLRWAEDPEFSLDRHLLRKSLPAPGGEVELAKLVGEYAGTMLERDKPLWEVMLVDGLGEREVAAVAKVHHAAMDGGRLVALLGHLFDESAETDPEPPEEDDWKPDRLPSTMWLAADTIRTLASKPGRAAHAITDIASALRRSADAHAKDPAPTKEVKSKKDAADAPEVPWTPWTGALSTHRSVAFSDVAMEDLRRIRAAFGTTINDVVLAAATASLRSWLMTHHALPESPLLATVPIAIRGKGDDEDAGNRVSMLRVHLPILEEDPVKRLLTIHAETKKGKEQHRSTGGNVFQQVTDLALNITVPWVLMHAVEAISKSGVADLLPAFWNLVISNVPGPNRDLYCGGARVTKIYPFGPVQHGSGLNLTVLSTPERMCLGALACRERVPGLSQIAEEFVRDVERLTERAAEVEARS